MTNVRDRTPMQTHDGSTPTAELVRNASEQITRLVRDELELARTEMTAKGKRAGLGAGMLGTGGVIGLFGLAALLVTAGLALDLVVPGWLAALIVSVALLGLAGLLAIGGGRQVKRVDPVPKETVGTVREDIDELKRRAHR
jgi:Putative Actinobacterial Holin-X, holin superfamily III